jgi:DNA-binding SARP family transcriptional activator
MIVCRTLGPVQLDVSGAAAPPELYWRKNLALLVYLARSPKRARAREHLIGLLWGDKPEAVARHSLNEAVRTLRRFAGEGGLETDAHQVRLPPGVVELDTESLEALAAAGDVRHAAELVQGEFLEGFSVPGASGFDDWMTAERTYWRRRCVDVLVQRADELLAAGSTTEAQAVALRALNLDVMSDAAARAVMRGLALAGDRAGALAQFAAFAARLKAEVGGEPDADTQALAARVRRERAWHLPERVSAGAELGAEARRAPLVGRAEALGQLVNAWTRCRHERHAVVAVVTGDAGMGKTRLAEELVARARLDGAVVAGVRAVEGDRDEAWSGVFGLARGGLLDAPGVVGAPPRALAQARGDAPPEAPGRALTELLQAIAEERPVVVFADDAHWLDQKSLLALGGAARDLGRAPVLFLLTAAAQPPCAELDELRTRVGRELAGAVVRVAALPTAALRALARWAMPAFDAVQLDRVTRRVATDSAGIPLLAVALLQAVAWGLDWSDAGAAWPEPSRTLEQTLPGELPDAVVAAIRVGFGRLSADAQRLLVAAAVLGGRVAADALARAAGVGGDALMAALDELEWQRWLSAESRGYAFVARIVREVVDRDMVTSGQRERIRMAAARPA